MIKLNNIHQLSTSYVINKSRLCCIAIVIGQVFINSEVLAANTLENNHDTLSFDKTITAAQSNDPWLTGNIHQQKSLELMSRAVNNLPDPKVSIGLANLPVNGFDFDQEGMTQAKIGIAQMFPRGDTLALKSEQLNKQSEAFPYQRINRKAQVAVTVGNLWLDTYKLQQSIVLIEKNRALFTQLSELSQASYSSAVGKTRQQDIVRAQLELTYLEDRIEKLKQQKINYTGLLVQWLTKLSSEAHGFSEELNNSMLVKDNLGQQTFTVNDYDLILSANRIELTEQLPQIRLIESELVNAENWLQPERLAQYFIRHPSIVAIEKKISASQSNIELAKQKYKPEWGVNASYGYRSDDPTGQSRADFFSVGVTFDVPLFTENNQDKEVKSAIFSTEAIKTEKILLLKQLVGAYSSAKGRLQHIKSRQQLYTSTLLPQTYDQGEAALTAYTNDDGDFSEVVRSRIAMLNAQIDQLALDVDEKKINLEINYLLMGNLTHTEDPFWGEK